MIDIEIELFDKLAFCWEFFEKDGLTGEKLKKYEDILKNSILVIGSGQGIVSKSLISKNFDVMSIDCLESMAKYAKKRFSLETKVINFLDLDINKKFNTIIVNTGVIYPKFIKSNSSTFIKKLDYYLTNNGYVILSFFLQSDFDNIVDILNINKKSLLLFEIWQALYNGQSITNFFQKRFKEQQIGIEYIILKYKKELEEFGQQILDAGCAYMKHYNVSYNDYRLKNFITNTLFYVSYGLSVDEQIHFMNEISKFFKVDFIDTDNKLAIILLSKKG